MDCPENREFCEVTGIGYQVDWPEPEPGSVQSTCSTHHGPIWVSPAGQRDYGELAKDAGSRTVFLCYMCSFIRTVYAQRAGLVAIPFRR